MSVRHCLLVAANSVKHLPREMEAALTEPSSLKRVVSTS